MPSSAAARSSVAAFETVAINLVSGDVCSVGSGHGETDTQRTGRAHVEPVRIPGRPRLAAAAGGSALGGMIPGGAAAEATEPLAKSQDSQDQGQSAWKSRGFPCSPAAMVTSRRGPGSTSSPVSCGSGAILLADGRHRIATAQWTN